MAENVFNEEGELIWPPQLERLKSELKLRPEDTSLDDDLQVILEAAIEYVQDNRKDLRWTQDSENPNPGARHRLGTIRLAKRWYDRLRTPNGLLDMGEFGASRIAWSDPDIDKMLGIGRHKRSVIA